MDIVFEFGKSYEIICSERYICCIENKVRLYCKRTGELVATFSELKHPSYAAFEGNEKLVIKNAMGEYCIYRLSDFSLVKRIKFKNYGQPQDANFLLLNNAEYLLSSIYVFPGQRFFLHNTQTEETIFFDCPQVRKVSFLRNLQGKIYAIANIETKNYSAVDPIDIALYDLSDIVKLKQISEPTLIAQSLSVGHSAIFDNLIIADIDRQVLLYDALANKCEIFSYLSECNSVRDINFSSDGKYFAFAAFSEVIIFNTEEKEIVEVIKTEMCSSVDFIENDTKVLLGGWKKSVCYKR